MRIAVYYNHKEDVGHIVRILRIIEEIRIRKPCARIFIFQAGKAQPVFEKMPGVTWIRLPRPFYSRANYYSPARIAPAVAALRSRFLTGALAKIGPSAFVTDFFPFGRRECSLELSATLNHMATQKTKVFACVATPYFSHAQEELGELLYFSRFYHKILIHAPDGVDLNYIARRIGQEGRIAPPDFVEVFRKLKSKLCFTGYVLPAQAADVPVALPPLEETILVHRGGGSTSPEIVMKALLARRFIDPRYSMLVVAGPATTNREMRLFKDTVKKGRIKGVELRRFVPSLIGYIERCAICVGTAGGTAHELLYFGKKSVVIPFTGCRGAHRSDQLSRADLLGRLIGATILDYDSLTAEGLAKAINRKLRTSRHPIAYRIAQPRWFDGRSRSADVILSDAEQR